MEFEHKLQQLRKQKNLTQEELAEALFVSRTAISKWESGRGYPSIDSLKIISQFFLVSIDDLLSSEEVIFFAEKESKEKVRNFCDVVFGILDCVIVTLFFLPLFGQIIEDSVIFVSLYNLIIPLYIWLPYIGFIIINTLWGVAELALQNVNSSWWIKNRLYISLVLSIFGTLIFIASGEPYAATFVFFMLLIKGIILLKQR